MGTASTTKLIKNNGGTLTEETTLTTSAGAGDANKVPALNAAGILDDSILNASAASGANKVVKQIYDTEKFDLILQGDSVVFSSPRVDITDKVIKALNAQK